jgi:hypothetical protein
LNLAFYCNNGEQLPCKHLTKEELYAILLFVGWFIFLILLGGYIMVAIVAILIFVGLLLLGAILNGFALSILWGWFMIPTFQLPEIGIVQAIGIGLVISFLTHQRMQSREGEDARKVLRNQITGALIQPIAALLLGWVVHKFM